MAIKTSVINCSYPNENEINYGFLSEEIEYEILFIPKNIYAISEMIMRVIRWAYDKTH